nr:lamin tail domain-containing protein [Anaerolineales bacterium]
MELSATLAVEGPTATSRPSATAALEAGETPVSPATLTLTPTGEAELTPEATATLTPAPPGEISPLPPLETWLPALETPTAAPAATSAESPTPAPASSTPSATGPAPAASVTPTEAAPPTLLPEPSATSAPAVYFVLLPPPVLPDPAAAGALASIGTLPATSVLISQLYGGGGNAGAPLAHDFVELYNLSAAGVDLAGWSLQYATAAGSAWQVLPLAGVVPPGGFWLIALGSGGAAGSPGPAPDLTW